MEKLINDLDAEYRALEEPIFPLNEEQWETTTPLANWTIKEQIRHIAYVDQSTRLSATAPEVFNQQWMAIAQAFAGPPEESPLPGARVNHPND